MLFTYLLSYNIPLHCWLYIHILIHIQISSKQHGLLQRIFWTATASSCQPSYWHLPQLYRQTANGIDAKGVALLYQRSESWSLVRLIDRMTSPSKTTMDIQWSNALERHSRWETVKVTAHFLETCLVADHQSLPILADSIYSRYQPSYCPSRLPTRLRMEMVITCLLSRNDLAVSDLHSISPRLFADVQYRQRWRLHSKTMWRAKKWWSTWMVISGEDLQTCQYKVAR